MISFFSIELLHKLDLGKTPHLRIRLAAAQENFIHNNRILIRESPGFISCYLEDDQSLAKEVDWLYFWVICTDDSFYQRTAFPSEIIFNRPLVYWTNSEVSGTSLIINSIDDLIELGQHQVFLFDSGQEKSLAHRMGTSPENALGCIVLKTTSIEKGTVYTYEFQSKKTFWQYHIRLRQPAESWSYYIVDAKGEWEFRALDGESEEWISFESVAPIAYQNRASDRLTLQWDPDDELRFEESQRLVLPFAHYAHKTIDGDNREITPIYIHI